MPSGTQPHHGLFLETRTLVAGAVALVGVGLLALFLWMVPSAADREVRAACAGLRPTQPNPAATRCAKGDDACRRSKTLADWLCKPGESCQFPIAAPDFTAVDFSGKPVHLSDFRGKVVLLDFWASWCGACETEKPHLARLAADFAGKDLVVIALASDRSWSDVLLAIAHALAPGAPLPSAPPGEQVPLPQALAAYHAALPDGVPFEVYLDPPDGDGNLGRIARSWGLQWVPDSVLIDRDGNIRAYFVDKRNWQSPVAETCIRSVIDGRGGTE